MEAIGGIERRKKPEMKEKNKNICFSQMQDSLACSEETLWIGRIARMHYGLRQQRPGSPEKSQSKLD